MNAKEGCAVAIGGVALIIILYIFGGWLTSVAWNIVIPHAFGLPHLNWVQGIGLAYLLACLSGWTARTHDAVMKGVAR
jgi:hypothetical protein